MRTLWPVSTSNAVNQIIVCISPVFLTFCSCYLVVRHIYVMTGVWKCSVEYLSACAVSLQVAATSTHPAPSEQRFWKDTSVGFFSKDSNIVLSLSISVGSWQMPQVWTWRPYCSRRLQNMWITALWRFPANKSHVCIQCLLPTSDSEKMRGNICKALLLYTLFESVFTSFVSAFVGPLLHSHWTLIRWDDLKSIAGAACAPVCVHNTNNSMIKTQPQDTH